MVVRRNLFIDKLSSPTLHVIGLYPGSGLVPRKTVIGINIATSASRSFTTRIFVKIYPRTR